ncbi:MAG: esterase-like activity of phytase family protein [Polaromonas sp.]
MTSSPFSFTALALLSALALSACGGGDDTVTPPAAAPVVTERSVASLRLIGQQVLPRRVEFGGTVVGGLSGIDYDAANNRYVLVSDDRTTTDSANAPRMYFANLAFDVNTFSGVTLASTFTMKQPNGSVYPKVPDVLAADPESVRFDPVTGNLLWVSEGQRTVSATAPATNVLIQPFVREITPTGTHVREYTLPANFQIAATDTGPRGNTVFEGLTVTPDRSKTVVIAEGALFQDGAAPTVTTGATSRITVFDRATGVASAQYAYPIERVQATPVPADQFTVNGPTEILAVTNTKFLVLERSFSVGVVGNQVRLYEVDISNATNVLNTAALTAANATRVTKRLVLDFETLKTQLGGIANLEGLTFGPKLANGRDSLVVVADDNFPTAASATDFNQFLVFEVVPQ